MKHLILLFTALIMLLSFNVQAEYGERAEVRQFIDEMVDKQRDGVTLAGGCGDQSHRGDAPHDPAIKDRGTADKSALFGLGCGCGHAAYYTPFAGIC